jgi:hypothetical protein
MQNYLNIFFIKIDFFGIQGSYIHVVHLGSTQPRPPVAYRTYKKNFNSVYLGALFLEGNIYSCRAFKEHSSFMRTYLYRLPL